MRFFGLKSCDTCRKALKALSEAGYAPNVIDVRADGIPAADLERVVATFGDTAINRTSTTWRGLSDAEKTRPAATLLRDHPALMKRPMIDHEGIMTLGWKADVQAKYLGDPG